MKLKKSIGILAFFISTSAWLFAEHVEFLGKTILRNQTESRVMDVKSCANGGFRVSAIKMRVTKDPAQIDSLIVTFGNDESQYLRVRPNFEKNTESRWIELDGDSRCIKRLEVRGRSLGFPLFGKPSVVEFFGMVY